MHYTPKVDDYVTWNKNGIDHKGWVYFADESILLLRLLSNQNPIVNIQRLKDTNIFIHF